MIYRHLQKIQSALLFALIAGFCGLLTWTGWLIEDAFITLRTVDNLINGYGLRWNVAERVQTYTHPLWMAVLTVSTLVTGKAYYSTIIISTAVSTAATFILALRITTCFRTAIVALLILGTSQAFVDYSNSGLENPLTHFLLASFILFYKRPDPSPLILSLIAGLATLNRMDTILFYVPALFTVLGIRHVRSLIIGFAPFVIWEAFSLFYYGFLFPNTAYAKLHTNIPFWELVERGTQYVVDSQMTDFITVPIIGAGIVVAGYSRQTEERTIALGIAIYVVYVIIIGGGYMSGRFLSAPFFMSLCLLSAKTPISTDRRLIAAVIVIIACNLYSPKSTLLGKNYLFHGDFYTSTSLRQSMTADSTTPFPNHPWAIRGRSLSNSSNDLQKNHGGYFVAQSSGGFIITLWRAVGLSGFYAGPGVHVVDALSIGDPLLARIPPYYQSDWQPGHLTRIIPEGYVETHISGENQIRNPALSTYYRHLSLITRGAMFDPLRLWTIIQFNLGFFDHLIDHNLYGLPSQLTVAKNNKLIRPNDPLVRIALARNFIAEGKTTNATTELEEALMLNPYSYENHMVVGQIFYLSGNLKDAERIFIRAINLQSNNVMGYVNLGGVLVSKGEVDRARNVYRDALEVDPENAIARKILSQLAED